MSNETMKDGERAAFEAIGRQFKDYFGHITPEEACRIINELQGKLNARAASPQSDEKYTQEKSISDEMMDLVDRLGSEFDKVDLRAWKHLLVYAPKPQELQPLDTPVEMNNYQGRWAYAAGWNACAREAVPQSGEKANESCSACSVGVCSAHRNQDHGAAAPQATLSDEQRDALNEAICWARDDGLPGTETQLRSILTQAPTERMSDAVRELTPDDADMVWPLDDGETFYHTLDDAVEQEISNAWPVEAPVEFEFQIAKRIPNVTVRVTEITESGHVWEIVAARKAEIECDSGE